MKFVNREMKVDQLIASINDDKINLIAKFQRGSVWPLALRKKLLENMVRGRPIPAIFLYKEESGAKVIYSILDGKQRLESLILFVGNSRTDLRIGNIKNFFWESALRKHQNFKIELDGKLVTFKDLGDETVRNFREYAIPTIEISLEDSSMDEIVELFVDINSYFMKVTRFDVTKAMVKDKFLGSVFDLIAVKQTRGRAIRYTARNTPINRVMNRLKVVARLQASNARVDRAWERLAEMALFGRTRAHKRPVDILKAFIKAGSDKSYPALTRTEGAAIKKVFAFLDRAYKRSAVLRESKLATNEPQFYTMVTALLASDLLSIEVGELVRKLEMFAVIIDDVSRAPKDLRASVDEFNALSAKATTDIGKRENRQNTFVNAITVL